MAIAFTAMLGVCGAQQMPPAPDIIIADNDHHPLENVSVQHVGGDQWKITNPHSVLNAEKLVLITISTQGMEVYYSQSETSSYFTIPVEYLKDGTIIIAADERYNYSTTIPTPYWEKVGETVYHKNNWVEGYNLIPVDGGEMKVPYGTLKLGDNPK